MKTIDQNTWSRKQLYDHFMSLPNPFFAITAPVEVGKAYSESKMAGFSFFAGYLHACMKALNETENMKLRVVDGEVVLYDTIHASATLPSKDETFGFSYIKYDDSFEVFYKEFIKEKERIESEVTLYPPYNGLDCIHCSAIPWIRFSSHKEPQSFPGDSVPKIAFSKTYEEADSLMMNVAVTVNHALVDGIHLGRFYDRFQYHLNN